MKFIAKYKKLSILFLIISGLIFMLGGLFFVLPGGQDANSAYMKVSFVGNGGKMAKNLFGPTQGWNNLTMGDDGASGGSFPERDGSYGMLYGYYGQYSNSIGYFIISPNTSGYFEDSYKRIILPIATTLQANKYYRLSVTAAYAENDVRYGLPNANELKFGFSNEGHIAQAELINTRKLFMSQDLYNSSIDAVNNGHYIDEVNENIVCYAGITDVEDVWDDGTFTAQPCFFAFTDVNNGYQELDYNLILTNVYLYETDSYGNPSMYNTVNYDYVDGQCHHMPIPERQGYDFIGFSTAMNDAENIVFVPVQTWGADGLFIYSSSITPSATYYAQWTPKTYTITLDYGFDVDFDGVNDVNFISASYEQELRNLLSNELLHRPGYVFEGFYLDPANSSTMVYDAHGYSDVSYPWDMNVTLYAKWSETWALYAQQPIFEHDAYQISTPEELAWIAWCAENGEDFDGINFIQTADIDLSGKTWLPIAREVLEKTGTAADTPFKGNYNGNGYKIMGMSTCYTMAIYDYLNPYAANSAGLFGWTDGARIENIYIDKYSAVYGNNAGGIVGKSDNSTIINCISSATIEGVSAGGIVGECHGNFVLQECINNGDIYATRKGGGVVGVLGSDTDVAVENLTNLGAVYSNAEDASIGGVIGYVTEYIKVQKCSNYGMVSGAILVRAAGGIIGEGYCYPPGQSTLVFEIENCINMGSVDGPRTGGLIGYLFCSTNVSASSCYVKAALEGETCVGGLIGYLETNKVLTVEQCFIEVECSNAGVSAITVGGGSVNKITTLGCIYNSLSISSFSKATITGNQTSYDTYNVFNMPNVDFNRIILIMNGYDQSLVIINWEVLPSSLAWMFASGKVSPATVTELKAIGYIFF